VYTDRAATDDISYGIMMHFRNRYAFAVTKHDSETGIIVNFNLATLFRAKQDEFSDWKERFRENLK
jgi:hypothetical protein